MLDQLQSLATRLEGLSGADRAVGFEICKAFLAPNYDGTAEQWFGHDRHADPTASLDVAVALVERLAPDLWFALARFPNNREDCRWVVQDRNGIGRWFAPTAPLALLRALVSAKLEEERASISTIELGGKGHP